MVQVKSQRTSIPKGGEKGEERPLGDAEAIRHLRKAVREGRHWYIALLEAMALWSSSEETHRGRHYCYLIANEAFDWLLLAERLCAAINGYIPQEEKEALLFYGRPPLEMEPREFRRLIGSAKYRAYLNYVYGIMVEEALILAAEEDIYKEQRALGFNGKGTLESAYHRIYGSSQEELLERFQEEKGYPKKGAVTLKGLEEFTYWLFRYRLSHCDRARVASDTRKGLEKLRDLWSIRQSQAPDGVESPSHGPV